jgi:hypothetical protein
MSFGEFSKYLLTGHKEESINSKDSSNMCFDSLAGVK